MMWLARIRSIARQQWAHYTATLGAVAMVTAVIWFVAGRTHLANVSMLYLAVVLGSAVAFGRAAAILASVTAFLLYDYFFTLPYYTFTVSEPEEWVALVVFMVTAIVTGQLAAGQRARAEEARQREREAVVLYDVARLMSGPDLPSALNAIAERLRSELGLAGVAIEVAGREHLQVLRASAGDTEAVSAAGFMANVQLLHEGPAPTAERRGTPGRWIGVVPPHPPHARARPDQRLYTVPVKLRDQPAGNIVLVPAHAAPAFRRTHERLLSAVATQLGQALERIELQQEATEAEVLRRTDELKTALINAVSHDLRSPLASIITSAGSLRQEDVPWTAQERAEFAETIEHEAERLNRIIGNLLDLSRMEGGNLQPEKGWYDLGALVDDVLGRLRPLLETHPTVVDIPEDLPPVLLDYVEIDQVLSNLLENAAKYTPAGTEIGLTVQMKDVTVLVDVTDSGPGIPERALGHVFDAFYRGEGNGARPKGTGLGLAVARGLVEAHGGRITAENRNEGGARFSFTLPAGDQ